MGKISNTRRAAMESILSASFDGKDREDNLIQSIAEDAFLRDLNASIQSTFDACGLTDTGEIDEHVPEARLAHIGRHLYLAVLRDRLKNLDDAKVERKLSDLYADAREAA